MNTKTKPNELLQELGFTEYEARAYLGLLGASDRNGYEVAKVSGIPRANVYPVLEKLVARKVAKRVETRAGKRYVAVPPERLFDSLAKTHRQNLEAAREAFAELESAPAETPVFNLRSRNELLARANELLNGARHSLLVAIQPEEAAVLAPAIAGARERGVTITTLCMEACARECGGCAGEIHRYCLASESGTRWLMLVADEECMVAAEMRAGAMRSITTEQSLVVELATAYIRQSLALATVGGALGERFDGLLSEQARRILDATHPGGGFLAWIARIQGEEIE